jgi:ribonuclease R
VTTFGLFVQLDALYVEGLVHITELGGEYFKFDEVRQELRGERTGIRYATGARVQVQVSRVDLDGRKIDFRLVREQDEVRLLQRAMRDKHGDNRRQDRRGGKRGAPKPLAEIVSAPEVGSETMSAVEQLERIEKVDRALKAERRTAERAAKTVAAHPVKAAKRTARGAKRPAAKVANASAPTKAPRKKRS